MNDLTEAAVHEMARQAAAWIASPEGRAAMAESSARAAEKVEKFRRAARVDWHMLHEPVTI